MFALFEKQVSKRYIGTPLGYVKHTVGHFTLNVLNTRV